MKKKKFKCHLQNINLNLPYKKSWIIDILCVLLVNPQLYLKFFLVLQQITKNLIVLLVLIMKNDQLNQIKIKGLLVLILFLSFNIFYYSH